MAMTLRADKGAILSWNEMDANFKACLGVHNLFQAEFRIDPGESTGDFTSGAWRTRVLDLVIANSISGASLASNQITLPAGNYFILARCPVYYVNASIARLYNLTAAQALLYGTSGYSVASSGGGEGISEISDKIYLSEASVLEIQHKCTNTRTVNGFGLGSNVTDNPYTVVCRFQAWKLS